MYPQILAEKVRICFLLRNMDPFFTSVYYKNKVSPIWFDEWHDFVQLAIKHNKIHMFIQCEPQPDGSRKSRIFQNRAELLIDAIQYPPASKILFSTYTLSVGFIKIPKKCKY